MTENPSIAHRRLESHSLLTPLADAAAVVHHFGAVQAQDYHASLWALGQRTRGATEAHIEASIEAREIVRTWPMRGTLHYVHARDVRWMLRLLAPRAAARAAGRHRQLELDDAVFDRARRVIEHALRDGAPVRRSELTRRLEEAGIAAAAYRGMHILVHLAHLGVLCYGPRDGRQHTFVLLEEWVPKAPLLTGDEALAQLASRYFASHGPATAHDFAWWSGLTLTAARAAAALAGHRLQRTAIDDTDHWLAPDARPVRRGARALLLPAFDEYTVAYRDRSAIVDAGHADRLGAGGLLFPVVVVGGRVVGTWRRTITASHVNVEIQPFATLRPGARRALGPEIRRYAAFLDRPLGRVVIP